MGIEWFVLTPFWYENITDHEWYLWAAETEESNWNDSHPDSEAAIYASVNRSLKKLKFEIIHAILPVFL